MDTVKSEGVMVEKPTVLWSLCEEQLDEVFRAVRLLGNDVHAAAVPLLSSLHTLSRQPLNNEEYGRLARLLVRVLGTMFYAPELAVEAANFARELLYEPTGTVTEQEENLLPLQAALAVFDYQIKAQQDAQSVHIAEVLQSVTVALNRHPGDTGSQNTFLLLMAGCLNYVNGYLSRTLELYERYSYCVSKDFPLWNDMFCMYASIASSYCEYFPLSLGVIESFRNTAEITGSSRQSLFWRVHLSFLLLHMNRLQEALPHIDHVLTVTVDTDLRFIHSVGIRALALYHYKNDNPEAAARILAADVHHTLNHTVLVITDPVVLEMLYDLQVRHGFFIPRYEIKTELERLEHGPNCFLRGIGLRLRSLMARENHDDDAALDALRRSFQELLHSGNHVECVRTGIELERQLDDAGLHAELLRFRERLSRMRAAPMPDDVFSVKTDIASLHRSLAALYGFSDFAVGGPSAEHLARFTGLLRRELSAQRVVLLRGTPCGGFEYAAGSNLTEVEVCSEEFRNVLHPLQVLCHQASPEQPVLWRQHKRGADMAVGLAVFVSLSSPWLLYMDNSLGTGEFMSISQDTASLFCAALAAEIRGILHDAGAVKTTKVLFDATEKAERMPPLFDKGLRPVLDDAERAAETSASVLILGETGVGKEILARYIHERSGCSGPFVPVHLACISEHLFESELFGHEKGAFTGAVRAKTGLVELARNGVLFLDEVGDIPLNFQIKLLRFLQEREFMRVGGVQSIRADFRLITATNRDLPDDVCKGRFREDLYHRLAVIPLHIPPLRERKDDILPLARAFRRYYVEMHRRSGRFPTDADLATLTDGQWPGNIRELQGVVERAVVLERWHAEMSPVSSSNEQAASRADPQNIPKAMDKIMNIFPTADALLQTYIRLVLDKTGGKIYGADGAAAILGMTKSTLYARMKKMGI